MVEASSASIRLTLKVQLDPPVDLLLFGCPSPEQIKLALKSCVPVEALTQGRGCSAESGGANAPVILEASSAASRANIPS